MIFNLVMQEAYNNSVLYTTNPATFCTGYQYSSLHPFQYHFLKVSQYESYWIETHANCSINAISIYCYMTRCNLLKYKANTAIAKIHVDRAHTWDNTKQIM